MTTTQEPEVDYLAEIIQRAKRGDVFTLDEGDEPVAVVLPARYLDKLKDTFGDWNDGRLVVPEEGHGWSRVGHFLRFLARKASHEPNQPHDMREAQPL
jgi:antitoxin (DNA-binding transcriptional repressor) of toxin-antitoxin stability system